MVGGVSDCCCSDVLQSIQRDWDFMASADCVPVQVALHLMDTSTLGKAEREPEFLNVHEQIQETLKSIVNGLLPQIQLRPVYTEIIQNITKGLTAQLVHTTRSSRIFKTLRAVSGT